MEQYLCYLLFALGLVIIIKASDFFVDSAIWVARATGIPDIIVGATLVSLCTTLPEAVVSSTSAAHDLPEMAFGNAFGSIVFNTTFILGITFLFSRPPVTDRDTFVKNTFFLLLLAAGTGVLLFIRHEISRAAGLALLFILVLYLIMNVVSAKKNNRRAAQRVERVDTSRGTVVKKLLLLALGAAGVIFGSNLLVDNGTLIAKSLGVSELIIGLTITAVGTSLPELVTAIQSMIKKAQNLSVGNIIGADILNIILVTGLSSVIHPMQLDSLASGLFSVAAVLVVGGAVLWFGLTNEKNFTSKNGVVMLALYVTYIAINMMYFAH